MSDETSFSDLMARVCRGEATAAEELFHQFEAQVRLEVNMRMRDPRLRRLVDEADVCQSVMLSFFVRARVGTYDLADPNELRRLLAGMARNKVAAQARRHSANRRDFRRAVGIAGADAISAAGATPSQVVAGEELLREVRNRFSAEEGRVADLRGVGKTWAEVAAEVGGTADACRVQLQRAVARIGRELGLEDADD
jgi:RNA polymerase sigma-70 factor (ECF subfamily)